MALQGAGGEESWTMPGKLMAKLKMMPDGIRSQASRDLRGSPICLGVGGGKGGDGSNCEISSKRCFRRRCCRLPILLLLTSAVAAVLLEVLSPLPFFPDVLVANGVTPKVSPPDDLWHVQPRPAQILVKLLQYSRKMNSWDDKKKVLTCKSGDKVLKIAKCLKKIQDFSKNKTIGVVSDFPELIRVFQTVMHGHVMLNLGTASVDYYSFCSTPDLCPSSCKKWDSRLRSTEFHVINMIHAVQVHGVRCQAATFAIHPGLKVTAISETEETIAEEPAEQGTSAAPPDESVAVEFKSVFAAGEVLNPTSIRRDELGAVVEDSFRIINPPGHWNRRVPFSCLRFPLKNDPVYWATLADTLKSGETLTVRPDLSFHYCAAKET